MVTCGGAGGGGSVIPSSDWLSQETPLQLTLVQKQSTGKATKQNNKKKKKSEKTQNNSPWACVTLRSVGARGSGLPARG